ncbi:MAG: penicillin-binding transpeptidase domain-containing protein [Lachnospiraceae bacterium]|nr:penicillin-binding transpeptidase domain-containing protein [Lachnospiraceae bacterium]
MQRKLAGLFVMAVLALVCLLIRITYINTVSGNRYRRQVLANSQSRYTSTTLAYKRGDILDRNGVTLATSEKKYNVILDCSVVNSNSAYTEPVVYALVTFFGADEAHVRDLLTGEKTRESQYQVIKEKISVEEKQAYDAYKAEADGKTEDGNRLTDEEKKKRTNTRGIWFEEEYDRVYPMGSLAGDVIGFVYDHDRADWGIEGYYNNILKGVDGRKYGYFGSDAEIEQTLVDPVDGGSVRLTLDSNIQSVCEDTINSFVNIYKNGPYSETRAAENIAVMVMDPNSGAILAMANSEQYDPNNPRDLSGYYTQEEIDSMGSAQKTDNLNGIWRNFCVSDTYEPGSVYKPITVSSALQSGVITGDETFVCDGYEVISGVRIKCSNQEGHGRETLTDVVKNSCNDGIMQIGQKLGAERFSRYQKLFGFGKRTGIDLSGEAAGIIGAAGTMGQVDLATASFGQGFTCTMVQEIAAVSSIVNGGTYYRPYLAENVLDKDGNVSRSGGSVPTQTVTSADVSDMVRGFMKASVDSGTSRYSKVDGYSMGGKTGTAQKIPRGNGKYIVSYIGFVPANDPKVVIYCIVDEPNVLDQADNRYPQWIARDILKVILPYMGIYPDEQSNPSNAYLRMDFNNPTGNQVITSAYEAVIRNTEETEETAEENETEEAEPESYIASIDEDGNLLNADGHFIDAEGYLINDDLEYVDENGRVIDEQYKIRAGEKSKSPDSIHLEQIPELVSNLGSPNADTVADTNVPEVQGNEDGLYASGGNTLQTDGYTNEEAGL